MIQIKKLYPIAIALLTLGLVGCGSDSEDTVKSPSPTPTKQRNAAWEFIETPYFDFAKETKLKGQVEVVLGLRQPLSLQWVFGGMAKMAAGDASQDLNGDGAVNWHDFTQAGLTDEESGPVFKVDTSKMIDYLSTNPDGLGAGTARPDIFVEGQYSIFDLLRYVVATRDDLRFEGSIKSYKESEYDTYEFNLSWDINNDGLFNTDDGKHFNSPFWHFGFKNPAAQNTPSQVSSYSTHGHAFNYKRMDQFWLRQDQSIRFLPYSEHMTNRRHWIWQQEMERLAKNNGEFIIPLITRTGDINGLLGSGATIPEVVARNVKVTPFNLRNDIYQPGVITAMDVWLTLAKEYGLDYRFTWWPILSTGARVNSFGLSYTPTTGEFTRWAGITPTQGELVARHDFVFGSSPTCNFTKEGVPTPAGAGEIDLPTCMQEFFNTASGNYLPEPIGTNHLEYPPEYMDLEAHSFAYFHNLSDIDLHQDPKVEVYVAKDELQHTNLDYDGSFDLYPTEDVTGTASLSYFPAADEENKVGNAPILDQTHFGWKIADCTQCHNDEKQPLGHGGQSWPVNKAAGFDSTQPYYCASCHGSNGAPEAHNRGASCFWCHNTNNGDGILPKNHGDVSKPKFIPAEKIVANHRTAFSNPVNRHGNIKLFDDMWVSGPNSDYTLSKTFPDPYSCGTCHGYEQDPE